jgi:hypothetical protein
MSPSRPASGRAAVSHCLEASATGFAGWSRSFCRVDALIEERALHDIHLFAAPIEVPTLQDRHLVRELVEFQLLGFEFCVAFGDEGRMSASFGIALRELSKQRRGQTLRLFAALLRPSERSVATAPWTSILPQLTRYQHT